MMTPLVLCLILSSMGGQATAQWPGNELEQGVVVGHETSDHCALCCASQATYAATCAQESQVSSLQTTIEQLQSLLSSQQNTVEQLQNMVSSQQAQLHNQMQLQIQTLQGRPRDCSDLLKEGYDSSGIYTIYPYFNDVQLSGKSIGVFCDMGTDGGGWTVFQRRQDGSEDFYRGWADYKAGFGKLDGEFWLGNDKLHQLTSQAQYEMRVDLEDFEGNSAYAQYQVFTVGSEAEHYRLTVGGYNGTAGNSLDYAHNGKPFSTKDRDYDDYPASCAQSFKGAWWYGSCHNSNLNGLYHGGSHTSYADGVNWQTWKGDYYSLKHTEMKIRPITN
ncbi:PREDICTED: microfibril-associated glycoprotein 4-like [Branchiostoma belcheri]|uniref:Microfibril-associated glycoprotein 4-like n=1 Tax=Branchiostoma belcheri TaxID=7741 RepID=A0A6P5ABL4_BRABE|nr:PREDICTED: microfibril-associated glycoprotein 4-like [Branchiostoma belcheri]